MSVGRRACRPQQTWNQSRPKFASLATVYRGDLKTHMVVHEDEFASLSFDVHDAKKVHVLVPGVLFDHQLDGSDTTSSGTIFSLHISSSAAGVKDFTLNNKQK